MNITKDTIKALLLFAAKQDIRVYLNAVQATGGMLRATDGHRLLQIKHDTDGIDGIIPREYLEALVKTAGRRVKFTLEPVDGGVREAESGMTCKFIDWKYPDCERVAKFDVVADELVPSAATYNPDYLVDARNAAQLLGKLGVALAIPLKAMRAQADAYKVAEGADVYAEAWQRTQGCAGHWRSDDGAVRITVMPLRMV